MGIGRLRRSEKYKTDYQGLWFPILRKVREGWATQSFVIYLGWGIRRGNKHLWQSYSKTVIPKSTTKVLNKQIIQK